MKILKVLQCQKIIENKIQKSLMQKNIRSILLPVMAINKYFFMISLISLLRQT